MWCRCSAILFCKEYSLTLKRLEVRRPDIGGVVVLGQPGIGTSLLWTGEQHSCSLIISLTSGFPDMGSLPYRLMITLCCYRHHRVLKPLSHMSRVDTSTGESATILPSLPFPRPPIREEEPKEKWGHINPAKEHKLS